MKEECLICKAPLLYLESDEEMECAICHKKEASKTKCAGGHYVCNACHMAGMDVIIGLCLEESSKNPVEIIEKMMALPFCHMHGPEHHVMVGAALLTAYRNAGGKLDLPKALTEMMSRGKKVPGGACGFWGSLSKIGEIGGPRCCKRDSFLSILAAVDFVKENFEIEMEKPEIICKHSSKNNQCIGTRYPFSPLNHRQKRPIQ